MRTPEGPRTRSVLALIGREIRESRSKSTVNPSKTPERSWDRPAVDTRVAAGVPAAAMESVGSALPFWVGATTGRKAGRVEGQAFEDRPERALQPVHGFISEAGAPACFQRPREGAPDRPGPRRDLRGADDRCIL